MSWIAVIYSDSVIKKGYLSSLSFFQLLSIKSYCTVIVTVAVLLSTVPSFALNVIWSTPVNPDGGRYNNVLPVIEVVPPTAESVTIL